MKEYAVACFVDTLELYQCISPSGIGEYAGLEMIEAENMKEALIQHPLITYIFKEPEGRISDKFRQMLFLTRALIKHADGNLKGNDGIHIKTFLEKMCLPPPWTFEIKRIK